MSQNSEVSASERNVSIKPVRSQIGIGNLFVLSQQFPTSSKDGRMGEGQTFHRHRYRQQTSRQSIPFPLIGNAMPT